MTQTRASAARPRRRRRGRYGAAYRPVLRAGESQVDVWCAPCVIGESLPVLPLRLRGDLFVPVDFEATYQEACRRRRIPP